MPANKMASPEFGNPQKAVGFLDRILARMHTCLLELPITGDILEASARKDLPPSQRTRQALTGITTIIIQALSRLASFCYHQQATPQSFVSKDLWHGLRGYFGPLTALVGQVVYLPLNPLAWGFHGLVNILTGGWTNQQAVDHFRKAVVEKLIWGLVALPGFAEKGLRLLSWKIVENIMATNPNEPLGWGVAGAKKVARVFGAGQTDQTTQKRSA